MLTQDANFHNAFIQIAIQRGTRSSVQEKMKIFGYAFQCVIEFVNDREKKSLCKRGKGKREKGRTCQNQREFTYKYQKCQILVQHSFMLFTSFLLAFFKLSQAITKRNFVLFIV